MEAHLSESGSSDEAKEGVTNLPLYERAAKRFLVIVCRVAPENKEEPQQCEMLAFLGLLEKFSLATCKAISRLACRRIYELDHREARHHLRQLHLDFRYAEDNGGRPPSELGVEQII